MADIKALHATVEAELAHAREIDATANRAELHAAHEAVQAAKAALSDAIAEGSNACPDCGAKPHGMIHQTSVRKAILPIFEVGCLACPDHRAQGFTPELAVVAWNTGEWLPPSEGGRATGRETQTLTAADVGVLKV